MKLLLIENDKNLSSLILDYFKEKKIQCDWANKYNIAEDKIISNDYDCILLDIMLPDGNGLELLDKILKEKKESIIIIISAISTLNTKVEALLKGA